MKQRQKQLRVARLKRWIKIYYIYTVILSAFLALAGCSCDDNNATCKPCVPPEQQQKGCLYKTCMGTLYACIEGDNVGDVDAERYDSTAADIDSFDDGEWTTGNALATLGIGALFGSETTCSTPRSPSGEAAKATLLAFKNSTCPQDPGGVLAPDEMIADANKDQGGDMFLSAAFKDKHGLNEVYLWEARERCREIAGIPKDSSGEAEQYEGVAGKVGNLSKEEREVFEQVLRSMSAAGGSGGVDTEAEASGCPGGQNAGGGRENGGPAEATQAGQNFADTRQGFGLSEVADDKKESLPGGQTGGGGGAATAANKPTSGAPTGKGALGTSGVPNLGGGPPGAKMVSSGNGAGANGESAGGSSWKVGQGKATAEDSVLNGDVGSGAASGDTGFASAGSGGSAPVAKAKSPFENLFGGGGAAGPAGAGGVTNANFGTSADTGGAADLEGYLSRNSKQSLFDIIHDRMNRWTF